MVRILKFLYLIFLITWELPQNFAGLLVWIIMKINGRIRGIEKQGHRIFIETPKIGVSLGWIIFWSRSGNRFAHLTNDCRMHEFGHSRQSVLLGPLYLVVVGIPSLTRALYNLWYRKKHGKNWEYYFDGFPENWADLLGGVGKAEKSKKKLTVNG